MAKSKKIDKDMGFRLKKARLDQKLTYDELSEKSGVSSRYIKEIENHGNVPSLENSDNSFVLYISLLIRFFIRQLQPIIWITKGCWFIFQNVRTIRSPLFLHLWKPIFVHIKPMRQNSRKISIFSGLFLNYSEEKQGGNSMIKRSTLLTYFIIVFSNSFTLTLSLTIPSPASICTASTIP